MSSSLSAPSEKTGQIQDERLFGWDMTPGIVSVWASREVQAVIWRRVADQVVC